MKRENGNAARRPGYPTYEVILRAQMGDGEALAAIGKYFDPFLRRLAMREVGNARGFDADLYERLRAKVLWAAFKFKFDPSTVTAEGEHVTA